MVQHCGAQYPHVYHTWVMGGSNSTGEVHTCPGTKDKNAALPPWV